MATSAWRSSWGCALGLWPGGWAPEALVVEPNVTRDIETEGRELVIQSDGRVQRSPVPEGFSPTMFRHIVAAVDVLYRRNGMIPTPHEVAKDWDGFSLKTVQKAFSTEEIKAALRIRGIEWNQKAGLTDEQLFALTILQDPTDRRTTKAKLDAIGVSMGKYRAWMRNPVFSGYMNTQAEQNLGDSVQMAINRLVGNAEAGDQRAIEKLLEMSGRWNPQQQEIQNARTVVLTFMEVIQSEVEDKELLARIMTKVRGKMEALTIVQSLKEL